MATPTNLYEYYTQKGMALPSLTTRAGLYTTAGLGSGYAGTAAQNTSLLSYLMKGSTPAPAPTSTPVMPTNTTDVSALNAAREAAVVAGKSPYAGNLASLSSFGGNPSTPTLPTSPGLTAPSSPNTAPAQSTSTDNQLLEKLLAAMTPSSKETDLEKELTNIEASRRLSYQNIEGEPIASTFQTGQKAAIDKSLDYSRANALGALELEQKKRQGAIDVSKTALEYGTKQPQTFNVGGQIVERQADGSYKSVFGTSTPDYTEVSPGATLFDPKTGKPIYTAPTAKQVAPGGVSGGGTTLGVGGGVSGASSEILGYANMLASGQATIANVPQSIRNQVVNYMNSQGMQVSKPLSDGAIEQITQSQAALSGLQELRAIVQNNQDKIGPVVGLAALNPYSESRQIQAQIDKVKQRVGKALEGGVLRKEDEEKYKKILAVITDTPQTALSKINGLISDIERDIANYTTLQSQSNRYIPPGTNMGTSGGVSKGSMTDAQFVEKALTTQGIKYQEVITGVPAGYIGVVDNANGQVGYIPVEEFSSSKYTKL